MSSRVTRPISWLMPPIALASRIAQVFQKFVSTQRALINRRIASCAEQLNSAVNAHRALFLILAMR